MGGNGTAAPATSYTNAHQDGAALVPQLLELPEHLLAARVSALGVAAQRLLDRLDLLDAVAPLGNFRLELCNQQPALGLVRLLGLLHLALDIDQQRFVILNGLVAALLPLRLAGRHHGLLDNSLGCALLSGHPFPSVVCVLCFLGWADAFAAVLLPRAWGCRWSVRNRNVLAFSPGAAIAVVVGACPHFLGESSLHHLTVHGTTMSVFGAHHLAGTQVVAAGVCRAGGVMAPGTISLARHCVLQRALALRSVCRRRSAPLAATL